MSTIEQRRDQMFPKLRPEEIERRFAHLHHAIRAQLREIKVKSWSQTQTLQCKAGYNARRVPEHLCDRARFFQILLLQLPA
jgi:hypothetical protein